MRGLPRRPPVTIIKGNSTTQAVKPQPELATPTHEQHDATLTEQEVDNPSQQVHRDIPSEKVVAPHPSELATPTPKQHDARHISVQSGVVEKSRNEKSEEKLAQTPNEAHKQNHSKTTDEWTPVKLGAFLSHRKGSPSQSGGMNRLSSATLGTRHPDTIGGNEPKQVPNRASALTFEKNEVSISEPRLTKIIADLWCSLPLPRTSNAILKASLSAGLPSRIQTCPVDLNIQGGWQLRVEGQEEHRDIPKALILYDPETNEGLLFPNMSRYGVFQADYEFEGAMPTDNFSRVGQVAVGLVDKSGRYVTTKKGRLYK